MTHFGWVYYACECKKIGGMGWFETELMACLSFIRWTRKQRESSIKWVNKEKIHRFEDRWIKEAVYLFGAFQWRLSCQPINRARFSEGPVKFDPDRYFGVYFLLQVCVDLLWESLINCRWFCLCFNKHLKLFDGKSTLVKYVKKLMFQSNSSWNVD